MTEWVKTTLGEIGHVVTGKTAPTSNPENYGGDVPFVTPTDMDGRRYVDATGRTLTGVGLSTVWKAEIPKDAVLVSCIGSDMGKAAMAAFTCVTNQQINSIIVGPECDPKFVYYNLSARKEEVRLAASGSAQPILNKSAFSRLRLILPPVEAQSKIASVLSCLDDKIELNRRTNETLEAMARSIFKDWFVDFGPTRAKAEGRAPYLASELWDLFPNALDDDKPVGWKQGVLGDVANSPRRGVSPDDVAEDTPYIGLEHMPRRSVALTEWEGAGNVTSNKSAFRKGEFLFGKLRPYFHKVGLTPLDGICSTDIVIVNSRASDWAAFTLACLSSDEFVDYTDRTSTGTKMPRTSWTTMGQYKIWLPSDKVARAFQSLAQPLLDRLSANIHEARSLAQTRDLLLPKLMSGEIRLREAVKMVEAVA